MPVVWTFAPSPLHSLCQQHPPAHASPVCGFNNNHFTLYVCDVWLPAGMRWTALSSWQAQMLGRSFCSWQSWLCMQSERAAVLESALLGTGAGHR